MNGLALIALAFGWAAVAAENRRAHMVAAPPRPAASRRELPPGQSHRALVPRRRLRRPADGRADERRRRRGPRRRLRRGANDHAALRRGLRNGRVVAVNRFDADYIDGGGRALIERNLAAAGLMERVEVRAADLTRLPFPDATFDAAVSTNVFDHLGADKLRALAEICRTLKPGGRFLIAVWTPSWPMFAVASVFSLFLTPRAEWRRPGEGRRLRCRRRRRVQLRLVRPV